MRNTFLIHDDQLTSIHMLGPSNKRSTLRLLNYKGLLPTRRTH
jgi:hypothetical protein